MSAANPAYRLRRSLMHRTRVVQDPPRCWEWRGHVEESGYGVLFSASQRYVHAVAYEEFCGAVPDGHRVGQTCGNRRCWRPEHLIAEPVEVIVHG